MNIERFNEDWKVLTKIADDHTRDLEKSNGWIFPHDLWTVAVSVCSSPQVIFHDIGVDDWIGLNFSCVNMNIVTTVNQASYLVENKSLRHIRKRIDKESDFHNSRLLS